jgi:hypothetical protein
VKASTKDCCFAGLRNVGVQERKYLRRRETSEAKWYPIRPSTGTPTIRKKEPNIGSSGYLGYTMALTAARLKSRTRSPVPPSHRTFATGDKKRRAKG